VIVLFSDYGTAGPYIGQVEVVLHQGAPGVHVVNLFADVPRQNPKAGAYLLPACAERSPLESVFFTVVDPGVGAGVDRPVAMRAGGRWFVGPDNGLFDILARRSAEVSVWEIDWEPEGCSNTFHGRDLYAPVCAMLASGAPPPGRSVLWSDRHGWPDDLPEIIYMDHFGNAMTGLRAETLKTDPEITAAGRKLPSAATFSHMREGEPFWYVNSLGLVEIAVNRGSAADVLQLKVGDAATSG
jgi:S-adenosylmethionine hydrolase